MVGPGRPGPAPKKPEAVIPAEQPEAITPVQWEEAAGVVIPKKAASLGERQAPESLPEVTIVATPVEIATPVKKQRDIPEDAEIIRWKTGPEQWGFAIRYGTKWRVFDSGYVAAESTLVEKTKWTGLGPSTIEVLR